MENLDFLPERIRLQRQRRKRLLRQAYLTALCIAGLVALGYIRQETVSRAQAGLETLGSQQNQLQRQGSLRKDLEAELGELQVLKRIDDKLGSRVGALDILAELDKLLPRNMALTNLSMEAVESQMPLKQPQAGEGDPARAAPVKENAKMVTVKRVRLMLTGVAPSDVDVANFIGQLSASPLLEDVNMGYTKNIEFHGHLAREFQASCYVTPQEVSVPRITKDNWIVLGILSVLVATAVLAVYMPQGRKLDQLKSQTLQQAMAMDGDRKNCSTVPELARQVEEMKSRYHNLDRRLPKQKELGGFLREISSNLLQAKLANQFIEPGKPDSEDLYHTLPIKMKFQGNYLSLANFLKRIDKMERLTRVQKMVIGLDHQNDNDENKIPDGSVNIELQLNIYFTES